MASTFAADFKQFIDSLPADEKSLLETRIRQSVEAPQQGPRPVVSENSQAQARPQDLKLDLSKWDQKQ